jgi:hypothetical protein
MLGTVECALAWVERYRGLAADAHARASRVLERQRASTLWLIPRHRVNIGIEYAASAIAHAEASGGAVPADVETMLGEFPVQVCGTTELFRAGMKNLAGDRRAAIHSLERAEAEPGRDRARMIVMGARFARGRLLAGSVGSALARGEVERAHAMGCAKPERFFASFWPGFQGTD